MTPEKKKALMKGLTWVLIISGGVAGGLMLHEYVLAPGADRLKTMFVKS